MSLNLSSTEYPSSTLRYGLLHIRPVQIDEIVKISGIPFRRTGIRLEREKKIQKFEDFIDFRYRQILYRMPLPEAFSVDDAFKLFVDRSIERFNKDEELKEELERKEKSLLGFVDFVKTRFENSIIGYYEAEADRFLNSNLPLSFFSQTSTFIDTYQKYLILIRRIVRRYEISSSIPGVRIRFQHVKTELEKMKNALSPLIDKMDLCSTASLALKLYVCIWSAENFEEIEGPKYIDVDKLDKNYFEEYAVNYITELKNMRKMVFDISKQYEPEILNREVAANDSTTVLLSKLLSSELP